MSRGLRRQRHGQRLSRSGRRVPSAQCETASLRVVGAEIMMRTFLSLRGPTVPTLFRHKSPVPSLRSLVSGASTALLPRLSWSAPLARSVVCVPSSTPPPLLLLLLALLLRWEVGSSTLVVSSTSILSRPPLVAAGSRLIAFDKSQRKTVNFTQARQMQWQCEIRGLPLPACCPLIISLRSIL